MVVICINGSQWYVGESATQIVPVSSVKLSGKFYTDGPYLISQKGSFKIEKGVAHVTSS